VKKLANNAQTVFTEGSWQQHHLTGSSKAGDGSKKKSEKKIKIKNIHSAFVIAVDLDLHPPWQAI